MHKLKNLLLGGILFFSALGCSFFSQDKVDVSQVKYQFKLERFDSALFNNTLPAPEMMAELSPKFPAFFKGTTSQFWHAQLQDKIQLQLYSEVNERINFAALRADFNNALKHFYYFFPYEVKYTGIGYISNLDFFNPVFTVDSVQHIYLALDMYLGKNHPAYKGMDQYLTFFRDPNLMVSETMETILQPRAQRNMEDVTLLNEMIWWGKVLYAKERCMPGAPLHNILRYEPTKLEFCQNNEAQIWLYFVKENLLFNTQEETKRRFLRLAPFSKFYTDFDQHSPGQIGKWIGYNIVASYMEHNPEVSVTELLKNTDHQKIFTNSKYKP